MSNNVSIIICCGANVSVRVTDGDRTWSVNLTDPLPPNFCEYDAYQETRFVQKVAKEHKAPAWVVETLSKYIQTIR